MENNATQILRRCTMRDMLIYPAGAAEKPGKCQAVPPKKNMLPGSCATDLSSFSQETLVWASRLEAVSEIILLHVLPARGNEESRPTLYDAEQKLAGIRKSLQRNGLKMTFVVREGDPSREISRIAEEEKASLILMSRGDLGRYISGGALGDSVAAVSNHLNHPLLVRGFRARMSAKTRELATSEFVVAQETRQAIITRKRAGKTTDLCGIS